MALQGKGLWAWRTSELDYALRISPQMGITHLLFKVGQGPWWDAQGRLHEGYYRDDATRIAQLIHQAGMVPLAWSFTTLNDVNLAVQIVLNAFRDGYAGFIFNVEDAASEHRAQAIEVGVRLAAHDIPQHHLYICSYPTPITLHSDIPLDEMGVYCQGGLMPMAYATYQRPPEVVISRWTYQENRRWMERQGLDLPIYPVLGPYTDPYGHDRLSREEFERWLAELALHHPSFFSIYTASVIEPAYFAPVRAFNVGTPTGPTGALWIADLGGGVLFNSPGVPGSQQTAFVYATPLTGTGASTEIAGSGRWFTVRTGETSGWMRTDVLQENDPGPWPPMPPPPEPPPGETLTVWSTVELNIRSQPFVRPDTLVGRIPEGTRLTILEDRESAAEAIGEVGEWLMVRVAPNGPEAWVAAWYVTDLNPEAIPEPTLNLEVVSPDVGYLNIRRGPSTAHPIVSRAPHEIKLQALEPEEAVFRKVGKRGHWLNVRTPEGDVGYAAAWYLRVLTTPVIVRYVEVESAEYGLRVRKGPGIHHEQVWWVPHQTILKSLEDPAVTAEKVGKEGQWLHVQTPARKEGYVAAWHLCTPRGPDTRAPVDHHRLPLGLTATTFGIHAVSISDDLEETLEIRDLFTGTSKRGWVLFTEAIGRRAGELQLNEEVRRRLWDWVREGYGVIIRLNHGYAPAGTLPESQDYDDFAAACARWVDLYLKRPEVAAGRYVWTLQIGNEPNNPREHPGGLEHPQEHVTPSLYARAFNKAYARIKSVLLNTIVCPAAVDPYNTTPMPLLDGVRWKPLEYFQEMLDEIIDLDGFTLHAYTHGPSLEAITSLNTFDDPFLADHYFDFQTYRLFLERIPSKWRDLPAYITETNHICRPPSPPRCDREGNHGWIDANTGWVREVYAEVNRWNNRPYAQQVRAVLLYRWMGDAWAIKDKAGILGDFRAALNEDYRWRS